MFRTLYQHGLYHASTKCLDLSRVERCQIHFTISRIRRHDNIDKFSGGVGKGLAQTQLDHYSIPTTPAHHQQYYQTTENTQHSYKTLLLTKRMLSPIHRNIEFAQLENRANNSNNHDKSVTVSKVYKNCGY